MGRSEASLLFHRDCAASILSNQNRSRMTSVRLMVYVIIFQRSVCLLEYTNEGQNTQSDG